MSMSPLVVMLLALVVVSIGEIRAVVEAVDGGTWCVVRSDANSQALQTGLDYACGSGGADCGPIQPSGLCYLPNTIQAHASYAFNSYYQRKNNAPGSCDFSGTATLAKTEPSYGSCVFPSNPSTAGGTGTGSGTPMTTYPGGVFGAPPPPLMGMPYQGGYGGGGGGGTSPSLGPPIGDTNNANILTSITSSIAILVVSSSSYFLTFHFQQRCLDIWHW